MLKCLEQFLTDNPTWNARVIATMSNGMSQLERATSCWPIELRDRMEILGHSPHHMIVEILNSAKMFFMPSRWEGFPTAAAEAVCMGCTVVGTPLESLDFLVANGFSGTLSRSFRAKDVSDALKIDSVKHRQGVYDAHEIADYWRTRLSMGEVTSQVCELLDEVLERNA
jgi:glycosyltransferase involved in cell wall biosynthesis